MKLSKNEQAVLDFLSEPRTSEEVAKLLNHARPPYGILRLLQRLDLVDRIQPKRQNEPSTYVATGRPMFKHPNIKYRDTVTVLGVRL